jgi:predicted small lipoprotein YifL
MRRLFLGCLVLLITVAVVGCGRDDKVSLPDKPTPPPIGQKDNAGGGNAGAIKE